MSARMSLLDNSNVCCLIITARISVSLFNFRNQEMKCLLKNLLGINNHEVMQFGESCTEFPPIVNSLLASALFLVFMVMLINALAV